MTNFRFLNLIVFLLFLSCQGQKLQIYKIQGRTMGTTYSMKFIAPGNYALKELKRDTSLRLNEVNQAMSTYIKNSEISVFNKLGANQVYHIENDFNRVLGHALSIANKTNGVFDPTIGPLVNLWGFGPDGKRQVPTKQQVEMAKSKVGFEKIKLEDKKLLKTENGVYLDLSASAKGYGVDALIELLQKRGIKNALVEIGGEVRTIGRSLTRPWKIGVESPMPDSDSPITRIVKIENVALATSGDYRNFFKQEGKRYQHTINFKSGSPVESRLASVSVVSDTCMDADAWATALMAMGKEKAIEFAVKNNLNAFFIYRSDDGSGKYKKKSTPGFDKITQ